MVCSICSQNSPVSSCVASFVGAYNEKSTGVALSFIRIRSDMIWQYLMAVLAELRKMKATPLLPLSYPEYSIRNFCQGGIMLSVSYVIISVILSALCIVLLSLFFFLQKVVSTSLIITYICTRST